jgi:thioredoxin-related protein
VPGDVRGNRWQEVEAVYRLIVSIAITLGLIATTVVAETRDPAQHFFHQSFGDLREELATAKKEGKTGVFMMFMNHECPWCNKMKASILNQVEVQDYYRKHFVVLEIDTEGSEQITDFAGKEMQHKDFALKHNRVRATPVFLFFDTNGNELTKYTGATRDLDEFMWLGEYVVDGHYKTTRFPVYKRERAAAAGKKP